jgi:hypothetical protein
MLKVMRLFLRKNHLGAFYSYKQPSFFFAVLLVDGWLGGGIELAWSFFLSAVFSSFSYFLAVALSFPYFSFGFRHRYFLCLNDLSQFWDLLFEVSSLSD